MRWFQPKKPVAPEPEISVYHSVDDLPVSQAVVSLPVEEPCFREPISPPGTKAVSGTAVEQAAEERDKKWQQCVDGLVSLVEDWNLKLTGNHNGELARTGNNFPAVDVEFSAPTRYGAIILLLLIILYRQQ